MSELPGTAAVGIDTVEWEARDDGNLTLRVSGRWRRRARGTSGKPTLILEAQGRRHRFSALPEPPGLGGAAPGTWQLSFTLPGTLAPDLGRTWLQFGTVIVPLPIAMPSAEELRARPPHLQAVSEPESQAVFGADSPADSEPDAEDPPHPGSQESVHAHEAIDMDDLGGRVAALERDLRHARAGRDELAVSLQERDRSRRIAEQRAHAEAALRQDLARQLSANLREMERVRETLGELASAEERIRRLEAELELAKRRSDEAEQIAAAARAARERAERERDEARALEVAHPADTESSQPTPPAAVLTIVPDPPAASVLPLPAPAAPPEHEQIEFERRLAERRAASVRRVPNEPAPVRVPPRPAARPEPEAPAALDAEVAALPTVPPRPAAPPPGATDPPGGRAVSEPAIDPVLPDVLRRELDARARAEASLRSRLVDAEATLAARIAIERRTKLALDGLREELAGLRDALASERAAREAAHGQLIDAEAMIEPTEARAREAEEKIRRLQSEIAEADVRTNRAAAQIRHVEATVSGAEARAAEAEARASEAESRAAQAQSSATEAHARAAQAEARAALAEARTAQAEARVGEAEVERAAADSFAQNAGAAREAAERRAAAADRRARAAAAEALELRETLGAREAERAQLASRVPALEARIAELEEELSGQRVLSRDAYDAIGDLRGTLEMLQARAEEARADHARAEPAPAEPEPPGSDASDEASPAPEDVPDAAVQAAPDAPLVDADRLSDALSRLRQTVPGPEPLPDDGAGALEASPDGPPGEAGLERLLHRRSLEVPFRRVVRTDADAAGRLLIELLPLQATVHPRAVAYDLVLGAGRGCVCVTSPHGDPPIEVRALPRPREEVDFRVTGEPARIARLLTAGRLRRLLGVGVARVRGRREGMAALHALIATPLDLTELSRGDVALAPASALALAAGLIEPAWTRGERFVLAHEQDGAISAYLVVDDGHPVRSTRTAPAGRVATTVSCPGGQLIAALAGAPVAGLAVRGDESPWVALRSWIRQSVEP